MLLLLLLLPGPLRLGVAEEAVLLLLLLLLPGPLGTVSSPEDLQV